MKYRLLIISIILSVCTTAFGTVDTLTGAQFLALINDSAPAGLVLIDLRNQSDMNSGVIGTAVCKPYNLSWYEGIFRANYNRMPKDIPIALYCASGNRSKLAVRLLDSAGYTRVYHLADGKGLWTGPTLTSSEILPLSLFPATSYTGSAVTTNHQPVVAAIGTNTRTLSINYLTGSAGILHQQHLFLLNGRKQRP